MCVFEKEPWLPLLAFLSGNARNNRRGCSDISISCGLSTRICDEIVWDMRRACDAVKHGHVELRWKRVVEGTTLHPLRYSRISVPFA